MVTLTSAHSEFPKFIYPRKSVKTLTWADLSSKIFFKKFFISHRGVFGFACHRIETNPNK